MGGGRVGRARNRKAADTVAEAGQPAQGAEEARGAAGTADTADTADTDGTAGTTAPGPRRHRRRTMPAGAARWLAPVAVVLLALAVVFAVLWNNDESTLGSQAQVRSVARSVVLNLTNLTPNSLDTRINDMESAATGQFATQLKQFFGGTIRQQLQQNQAQSQGQVRSLGIDTLSGSKASVLAVVDQTYANRTSAAPSTDMLYLQLDLTHTGSGWKVADVTNL